MNDSIAYTPLRTDSLHGTAQPATAVEPHPGGADSLPAADSLTDSLHPFGTFLPAEPALRTDWRDTSARAVFGPQSIAVAPDQIPASRRDPLIENPVFQGFVLLLAVTYGTLLYRNLADIGTLIGRISRENNPAQRIAEDSAGSAFSRFLNLTTAIGILFTGIMVVKYADSLAAKPLEAILPHGAVLALSLLASLACAAIAGFQYAVLSMAGALTLTQPFIAQLILLKRTYFALCVIVTSPALLLFALCPGGTGGGWFVCIAAELTITAILYLKESFGLFLSKKISILHWFLYLCAVEIFPISLVWLLTVR